MPQISTKGFKQLPLWVHNFLAGGPLHDVWVVDLPRRFGITLDEFLRTTRVHLFGPSPIVRALVNRRLAVSRIFGWDREQQPQPEWETFAARMTTGDRSRSVAPAGTGQGLFPVVHRFENQQLLEVINRNAHAAASSPPTSGPTAHTFRASPAATDVNPDPAR